jgi:hypothetical protein
MIDTSSMRWDLYSSKSGAEEYAAIAAARHNSSAANVLTGRKKTSRKHA